MSTTASQNGGPGATTTGTGTPTHDAGTLPFTGLDVWAFAVIGVILIGTGLAARSRRLANRLDRLMTRG